MKIRANGTELGYELSGEGPCLVLIHGFTDNLGMWYHQVPVLSKQFKVLRFDVRGHGETQTPEGDLSIGLFARDLRALLEALGIAKACVLGYSMGGRIALQFALEHPEATTGLIFANSAVRSAGAKLTEERLAELAERREQMVAMFETGDIELIADGMAERSFSPGLRERQPAVFQRYKDIKLRNHPGPYLAIMDAMVQAMASPPDLTQLRCPALIIAGDQDGFMALEDARAMEAAIPDATLAVFPTGHATAVESPQAFNQAVLDFVKRL